MAPLYSHSNVDQIVVVVVVVVVFGVLVAVVCAVEVEVGANPHVRGDRRWLNFGFWRQRESARSSARTKQTMRVP